MCIWCTNPIANCLISSAPPALMVVLELTLSLWAFVVFGFVTQQAFDFPAIIANGCAIDYLYWAVLAVGIIIPIAVVFQLISTVLSLVAGCLRDQEGKDEKRKSWFANRSGQKFSPTTVKVLEGIASIMNVILVFPALCVIALVVCVFIFTQRCGYLGEISTKNAFNSWSYGALGMGALAALLIGFAAVWYCFIFICCGNGSCGKTMKHKYAVDLEEK